MGQCTLLSPRYILLVLSVLVETCLHLSFILSSVSSCMRSPRGTDALSLGASGRQLMREGMHAGDGERGEGGEGKNGEESSQQFSSLGQQKRHRREALDVLHPLVRRTGDDRRRSFGKMSGNMGSSRSTRTQLSQRALALAKQRSQRSVRERLESQIAKSGLGLRRVSRAKPGSNRWKAAADIRENNEREPTTAAHK